MKTKTVIFFLFFSCCLVNGQNIKPERLQGSWIGDIMLPNNSSIWCFATTSFIETEAIRLGKRPVEISPMFFVIPTDIDKAEKYIRMNGKSYFGAGDLTFSALKAYKNFGAVPQIVFSGKKDSVTTYNHGMMDYRLLERVKYYVNSGRGNMTADGYRKKIASILSGTLGEAPASFDYNDKKYTPKSFANEMIGINPDDYVEITSYSHHPFYSKFILEIESNWNNNYYMNLPLNDFSNLVDDALMHNYSVCWDGDIRDGYKDGFAVLNDNVNTISQEIRQAAFDNYTTIDQHNMHIIGIALNDKGKEFYILKNSSDFLGCGGYLYMSKEYFLLKTISVMTNKSAIPKEIIDKLTQKHLTNRIKHCILVGPRHGVALQCIPKSHPESSRKVILRVAEG